MSEESWAPDRIWLQKDIGDDGSHTWCSHPVGDDIIEAEYVRVLPGFALVPLEPTQAMMDAWNNSGADDFKIPYREHSEFTAEQWEQWVRDNARKDWTAMISATQGATP